MRGAQHQLSHTRTCRRGSNHTHTHTQDRQEARDLVCVLVPPGFLNNPAGCFFSSRQEVLTQFPP